MIVPFGKLEMVNCIDIGIDAFYIYDKKGFPLRHSFLTLCLLGIYFIYFKNRYYIIIGFILTYFWLIYKIDYIELISSLPVLISVLIYVLISFYTSFKIITNLKVSTFGFYPNAEGIKGVRAPSIIGNNGGDNYDSSVTISVSGSKLKEVLDLAKDYPEMYDVNFFNCTNYARNIGIKAGINIPSAYGFYPGGGGQNPGKLGQIFRKMESGNGITVVKTPSTAPAKGAGCE